MSINKETIKMALAGMLQERMKQARTLYSSPTAMMKDMASYPETFLNRLRALPGVKKAPSEQSPSLEVSLNALVIGRNINSRDWFNFEVPQSLGAKGVLIQYATIHPEIELVAGSDTLFMAALVADATFSDPAVTWPTTYLSPFYSYIIAMVSDDGAGTTTVIHNGGESRKAQPLILKRNDVDGKYYVSVIVDSANYVGYPRLRVHIRFRIFRSLSDPLIKGAILQVGPSTLGAVPASVIGDSRVVDDNGVSVTVAQQTAGLSSQMLAALDQLRPYATSADADPALVAPEIERLAIKFGVTTATIRSVLFG